MIDYDIEMLISTLQHLEFSHKFIIFVLTKSHQSEAKNGKQSTNIKKILWSLFFAVFCLFTFKILKVTKTHAENLSIQIFLGNSRTFSKLSFFVKFDFLFC